MVDIVLRNNGKAFLTIIIPLVIVPIAALFFNLAQRGYLSDSLDALQGEFFMFGLPVNPWGDFLPYFCILVLASMIFAVSGVTLATYLAQHSFKKLFSLLLSFLFAFIAAVTFEFSLILAINFHQMFEEEIVLGFTTPIPLGVPTVFACISLFSFYYCRYESSVAKAEVS